MQEHLELTADIEREEREFERRNGVTAIFIRNRLFSELDTLRATGSAPMLNLTDASVRYAPIYARKEEETEQIIKRLSEGAFRWITMPRKFAINGGRIMETNGPAGNYDPRDGDDKNDEDRPRGDDREAQSGQPGGEEDGVRVLPPERHREGDEGLGL